MRLARPRVEPLPEAQIAPELRERLGDRPLLNIFKTLANHPDLMRRWLVFGSHVLGQSTLPPRERELVILRVGWKCQSGYEWSQHVVIGKSDGLGDAEIARIPAGPDAPGWSDFDRVLLRAADELLDDSFVSDATWQELASRYDTRQLMDLVFTVGQYNLVSMALNTLGVQLEDGAVGLPSPVSGRLAGKVAVVCGAGQTPGETIGNGRATALLFAREGARVLLVDRDLDSARETLEMITAEGGEAQAFEADATRDEDCRALVQQCRDAYGRIDVLHNNVGIGGGDAGPTRIEEEDWDRILGVNLKSVVFPCKHALPLMREQRSGVITNISSAAAVCATGIVAYKTSKAGVNAYTQSLAIGNAKYGIRANVIMPGLMNTPMAIEGISRARGVPRDELIRQRDAAVPLGGKMGSAWDVAHAALFLASDEAGFITGAVLPVDGGQSARIG